MSENAVHSASYENVRVLFGALDDVVEGLAASDHSEGAAELAKKDDDETYSRCGGAVAPNGIQDKSCPEFAPRNKSGSRIGQALVDNKRVGSDDAGVPDGRHEELEQVKRYQGHEIHAPLPDHLDAGRCRLDAPRAIIGPIAKVEKQIAPVAQSEEEENPGVRGPETAENCGINGDAAQTVLCGELGVGA